MTSITVNSKAVLQALERVENLISQLAEPTEEVLEYLRQKMATYPPPPAGSTYVRTMTLQGGWQSLVLAGNRLGVLSNPVSYGPYVQGAEDQAAVHQGRWQTDEQVAEDETAVVLRIYDQYCQELLDRHG
jgi:hypothetical protein